MSDKVSEFYEDKKNVDEMQNWNSTLLLMNFFQ